MKAAPLVAMSRCLLFVALCVSFTFGVRAEAPGMSKLHFLRTEDLDPHRAALQTLSQEYRPASGDGPAIWLIGVAHLGTTQYYGSLQKRLDTQTSVLFEGVDAAELQRGAKPDNTDAIQAKLANALGLVFQLDAIDYHRKHFQNTDLTADKLNQAIEKRVTDSNRAAEKSSKSVGASPAVPMKPTRVDNKTFKQLMEALHGQGEMAESLQGMISLMGSTPVMQETTKLMLVETLSRASELIDLAKSASDDMKDLFTVIIDERNEEVLRQLRATSARLGRGQSVAVFYGAAHMDEIARRLETELGYRPTVSVWDTAFSADSSKAMLPREQIKALIEGMSTQLKNPGSGVDLNFPLFNGLPPPAK